MWYVLPAVLLGALSIGAASPAAGRSEPARASIDYLEDEFAVRRVLDWGDRPIWSSDGGKLIFTKSDSEDGPAYELDLESRAVRCLTCKWGANGLITRIFYLPDGSYLITARPGLETAAGGNIAAPPSGFLSELYWMPSDLSMPPQALQTKVFGDMAILRHPLKDGGFRVSWGVVGERTQLLVADIFHNGQRAALANRRVAYNYSASAAGIKASTPEAYDFADDATSVVFWSLENAPVGSGMYKVNINSGAVKELPGDGSHSETHLFPDDRFGLEESNRASDPNGPVRGISALPAQTVAAILSGAGTANAAELAARNSRKGFDLFVRRFDKSNAIRRLTHVSHLGGEAHQSIPSWDGRKVAFSMIAPASGPFAGKPGLYVGEFKPKGPPR